MHARTHACMHTYMHACMHSCVRACVRACVHAYVHTYAHTYIFVTVYYIRECVCVCMRACVCNANKQNASQEELKNGQVVFTHYFESKCSPEFPPIKVKKIEEKKLAYLNEVRDALELEVSDISSVKSRTVKEVKIRFMRCLAIHSFALVNPNSNFKLYSLNCTLSSLTFEFGFTSEQPTRSDHWVEHR